jgi:poly-gamma-glutamate synthase PgsB/CapB
MTAWALLPALSALGLAAVEARVHRDRLRRIPHRIHVNGTRGKSSVVRLIAAGLRAAGVPTVAKTTGSAARVILPDGREQDLRGRRRPSVLEYRTVAAVAARVGAHALVVECMAVRPEIQRVTEHRLMRSTIGVLTGAGLDHLGVMAGSLDSVIEALAETVPAQGTLIVPGPDPPVRWLDRAARCGTSVRVIAPPFDVPLPTRYAEWPVNVALALAVCETAGVPREIAAAGMRDVTPDPGALRVWRQGSPVGRDVWLVGAFGANDPVSTARIVDRVATTFGLADLPTVLVLNTRADRGERTLQWCEALLSGAWPAARVVLTGPHAGAAARLLARRGWSRSRVRACPGQAPNAVTEAACEGARDADVLVVGAGNVLGAGAALLAHWAATADEVHRG